MSQRQLKRLVRYFESCPYKPDQTLEEMRRDFEKLGASPLPDFIRAEATDAGGVKAEWLTTPEAEAGRAILYLHGGSYVMGGIGSIASSRAPCRDISRGYTVPRPR